MGASQPPALSCAAAAALKYVRCPSTTESAPPSTALPYFAAVPGFFFPEIPFNPPECPITETTPVAPQDPYALSKHFGEQLCDAMIRRAPGTSVVTIRPSWVQTPETIESNLGRFVADKEHVLYQAGM